MLWLFERCISKTLNVFSENIFKIDTKLQSIGSVLEQSMQQSAFISLLLAK